MLPPFAFHKLGYRDVLATNLPQLGCTSGTPSSPVQ